MSQPPVIATRERVRSARRQALLEAAEQIFAEKGFDGATMAEIAARAGYSAGNLYNVFESKEALLREVVRWGGERAFEQLGAALRGEGTLAEVLERFVRATLSYLEENRASFVFYIRVTNGLEWNLSRFGDDAMRTLVEIEHLVEERIRAALERKEVPAGDPSVYTSAVLGILHHYLTRRIQYEGSDADLRVHEAELSAVMRRMLGVKP